MAKRAKKPKSRTAPSPRRSARNIAPARRSDHPIELIARGIWLHGSRVLLCRNTDKGYLYLPGGHVEFGESAVTALEREFLEETGLRVSAGELVHISEGAFQTRKRWHHEINLTFRVTPMQTSNSGNPPTIRTREKGIAFEWIDLAAAVDLDIRPLAAKAWLAAGAPIEKGPEWVSEIAARSVFHVEH